MVLPRHIRTVCARSPADADGSWVYNVAVPRHFSHMTESTSASTPCPSCGARATGKFCSDWGTSLAAPTCRSCGKRLVSGARFCNECGAAVAAVAGAGAAASRTAAPRAPAAGTPANGSRATTYAPWIAAATILAAVVGYFAFSDQPPSGSAELTASATASLPAEMAPFAAGGGGAASTGRPPDLSTMSPRERAGRLYDRIMRYVEEGKPDSADFFAPMALASFEALGSDMDTDARYDYGRVASETKNFDIAAAQADSILRQSPTHLLGLSLSARTATLQGNNASAKKTWATFLASRDAELQKKLPEYEMHAADIEQATRIAKGVR